MLVEFGPAATVNIGFDPEWTSDNSEIPDPGISGVHALFDTGASRSCVDSRLAIEPGLPLIDRIPLAGVHGSAMANIYLAQIHIPGLNVTMHGDFVGVDLAAGGQPYSALVGREVMQRLRLVYDGQSGSVVVDLTPPARPPDPD